MKDDEKKDPQKKDDSVQKKYESKERLTLKNNAMEAAAYQEEQNKDSQKKAQNSAKPLPVGIQKMRQKIRDIYDEDDEDSYDYIFVKAFQLDEERQNSIENMKSEAEKRAEKQKETDNIVKAQQNAGRMEALEVASRLAREAGLKGLKKKTVVQGMQEAVFRPQKTYENAIKKDVSQELKIKGKVKDKEIIQAVRGIKTVESLGTKKALKNMEMSDMVKVGEKKMDQKELAELILKKSGQDITKYKSKIQNEATGKLQSIENKKTDSKEKDKKEQDFSETKKIFSSQKHDFGR